MKKRLFRQYISILATLALCLSLLPVTALADSGSVEYLDRTGTKKSYNGNYTPVTSETTTWGTNGEESWYVVNNDVTIGSEGTPQSVTFSGDVHLILSDNCTLTVNGGIISNANANLTIYAQSTGSSIGTLTATGSNTGAGNYNTFEGYGIYTALGSINIFGGNINATGYSSSTTNNISSYSYGIYAGGSLIISGSTVNATGGTACHSCGIYVGSSVTNVGSLAISGSTVNATGGEANVTDYSYSAYSYGIFAKKTVNISGSTVTATGGEKSDNSYGFYALQSTVTISDGTVNATGGTGSTNSYGMVAEDSSTVNISGGIVNAIGGTNRTNSYGMFAQNSSTVNISGGTVNATGSTDSTSSYGMYAEGSSAVSSTVSSTVTISDTAIVFATGSSAAMNQAPVLGNCMKVSAASSVDNLEQKDYSSLNDRTYTNNPAVKVEPCTSHEWKDEPVDEIYHCKKCKWCGSANTNTSELHSFNNDGICTGCGILKSFSYLDADGNSMTNKTASLLTSGSANWSAGWYVAYGNLTISSVTFSGDVHLILADGCNLTVTAGGIIGQSDANLTIYAQSTGSSMGKLTATGSDVNNGSSYGIYADSNRTITINGGNINATGGTVTNAGYLSNSGGIFAYNGGTININGGIINATGGTVTGSNSNIGSGGIYAGYEGTITINGGNVNATGGTVTSNNSTTGSYGIYDNSGSINISGGNVTAIGGAAENSHGIHAHGNSGGSINISGGSVTATGGAGSSNSYGMFVENRDTITINISGGAVIARTMAGDSNVTKSALNKAPECLPDTYCWSTDAGESFTASTTAYSYSDTHTYVEIRTTCTVTLDPAGGECGTTSLITNENGLLTGTLPAPARSGYTFNGWFTEAAGGTQVTTDTVFTEDTTIYAHWTAVSSGGGSSSGSDTTTTTEKNEDGSTTTTVTDKTTGTVTETTKNTDGSTTVVETKKDGTVTETNKLTDGSTTVVETKTDGTVTETCSTPDGTAGTVVTDSSGTVTEISSTVSAAAAEEASRTGGTVTLPVEVPSASSTRDAPAVEINIPESSGSVRVEIPVDKVTPGTVAIIVNADGTEEIVTNSIPVEQGVQLTLDGSAVVKIVDNSRDFSDVPASYWGSDGIDFASARGITGGTSDTTFSPGAPCTRDQIVTFLWRAAGTPEPENLSSFSDVPEDSYYAEAAAWALENGIIAGTGDGMLSPDATCTRAQAMTFLYRIAQAQGNGMEGQWMLQNPFDDVDPESYYGEAVLWAVANGITNGTGDATFDPDAECTRDQIVTFLYRSMR